MNSPDYDYHGLLASTWDVWRDNTENWSDSLLFLDIVRQYGQPALDVGCGTGRIILDYLSKGIDIDGVDNSPEFLEICRTKGRQRGLTPTLYQQRIETLALPRTYRTILGPSSVLQLVTNTDTARGTLRRFWEHLQPGGAFVTPFAFGWREGDPLDTGWELLFEKPRPEDGATVRSWVGTGANQPISPDQIHQAIGPDTIKELAAKFGMSGDDLAKKLSSILPQAVDHLTPGGKLPNS